MDNPDQNATNISNGEARDIYSKYNIKEAVKLPFGEDKNEWIAYNIFDFHKQICMLFGTIRDDCIPEKCPKMICGKKYEFLWLNEAKHQSFSVSASDYIMRVLDWVQAQLDDEDVFPSTTKEFPSNYLDICKTIARRLLRVYAHVYHHHLPLVKDLKQDAHMNTSLKHYIYFINEFNLVSQTDLDPLKEYVQNLR